MSVKNADKAELYFLLCLLNACTTTKWWKQVVFILSIYYRQFTGIVLEIECCIAICSEIKCCSSTYATFYPKSFGVYNLLLNFRLFVPFTPDWSNLSMEKANGEANMNLVITGHHFGIMWSCSVSQKLMNDCAKFAQEDLFWLSFAFGLNKHQNLIK